MKKIWSFVRKYPLFSLAMLALMWWGTNIMMSGNDGASTPVSYSDFYKKVEDGSIVSLHQEAGSSTIYATTTKGDHLSTVAPYSSDVVEKALAKGVSVDIRPYKGNPLGDLMVLLLPVALLLGGFYWLQRSQMKNISSTIKGGDKAFRAKEVVDPQNNPFRLKDVAGCDEAKKEVAEIVDFLRNPDMYTRVGARPPKGVLMSGPPGTGKTLLARAIAGESEVPFFSVSGSDFMEMFVGVGAARVRALFEQARQAAPAIIFIDEIDSIGRARSGASAHGGTEERDQTLNALLVEMDGFTPSTNVVVIAATNRSDVLDEAIRRPGRFDREVSMPLPDREGRLAILQVHAAKVPMAIDVSLDDVAKGTPGFSGADLQNLINEAAVLAARAKVQLIDNHHLEEARDKIIMGVQRGSLKNNNERRIVAYHEAGHAVVAHFTPGSEPIHKISIVPRGRALGVTVQLPKEDSYNHGKKKLLGELLILMGGRAAEDVVLGECTVGASNDFMRATVIARRMIASWGMDASFGPMSVDGERGNDWVGSNVWSEATKKDVDDRVRALLTESYDSACGLLKRHIEQLHAVADALLEHETLSASQFEQLVGPADV